MNETYPDMQCVQDTAPITSDKNQPVVRKSSGLKILVIILILVLLAGNAVSILLLAKSNKSNAFEEAGFNEEFSNSIKNYYNYFGSDGLAIIKVGDKYGYINKEGSIIIKAQFDDAKQFCNGLAIVCVDNKYGAIDTKGKYIISPKYDSMSDFSCGLSAVSLDDRYGYVDQSGKVVIPITYTYAYEMSNDGFSSVITESKQFAIIDKDGKIIKSIDYSDNLCKKDDCYDYISDDEPYCYKHKCRESDCTEGNLIDYSYCSEHKCNNLGCDQKKSSDSEYCYEHTNTQMCIWYGCNKEAKYGNYCFDHYYAIDY